MTPKEVVSGVSHEELTACVVEALRWRATGNLTGAALEALATRMVAEAPTLQTTDALRLADALVVEEAALRFVGQSATPPGGDVVEIFETVLVDRAGDGPSGEHFDPELLMAGYALIDEVKRLRAHVEAL